MNSQVCTNLSFEILVFFMLVAAGIWLGRGLLKKDNRLAILVGCVPIAMLFGYALTADDIESASVRIANFIVIGICSGALLQMFFLRWLPRVTALRKRYCAL